MATPKKKVSRSRKNMRRFSSAYRLDPVTVTVSAVDGEPVRTHCVTPETAAEYVALRNKQKELKKSQRMERKS